MTDWESKIKENYAADEEVSEETTPRANVAEKYGSAENIAKYGSPIESPIRYYFYPTWRSKLFELIGFLITCALTVQLSKWFPWSVVKGTLFSIGDTTYFLALPMFVLVPGFMLGKILIYIYDSKYIIDERGVEAQIGLVSLSLRQPRLRYEDIRGVEPNQTIIERILGIGSVLIGSAMTQDVEIIMKGVANPRAIQLLIGGERDRRLRALQANQQERVISVSGD